VHLRELKLNHESDSGDETRHSLKMQDVSLLRLPRALLCSRLMVCRCLPQLWLRFLIPRLTLNTT